MNEQLQQSLAQILNKASSGIDAGTTFLSEQIPDVVQQLLMYKMADASCGILISIFLLFSCVKLSFFCMKKHKEESEKPYLQRSEGLVNASGCMVFVTFVTGSMGFITNLSSILKISLAPKIYLIEYAASLTK